MTKSLLMAAVFGCEIAANGMGIGGIVLLDAT